VKPDLEATIRAVEALAPRRASVTRHDVRPILLSIGGSLLAGRSEEIGDAADRLRALPGALRESWDAAVRDELSMACTEYVRSVDPRFVNHPQYDLAYALEARFQLEARWRACAYLEPAQVEASTAAVARADAILEGRRDLNVREWLKNRITGALR